MFLGSCYYELATTVGIEAVSARGAPSSPGDPAPIGLQGADALHARGDAKEAGALYKKALAIAPDSELAIKNWDRYLAIESNAEPDAAPNGGPAASADNLNTPGGPPSVS